MVTRRSILKLAGGGVVAASLGSCTTRQVTPQKDSALKIFSEDQREILALVQNHMFPSEIDMPGAKDLNLTRYTELALTGSDISSAQIETIKLGLAELKALNIQSSDADIETILRKFEETDSGDKWLRTVMNYSIEGFLGDPAYGGNTDQLGWRAVGHHPGVPRPSDLTRIGRR